MMAAFSNMLVSLGCRARESGHPVISNSATLAVSLRILDHPLSRVMTAAELSDSFPLLINGMRVRDEIRNPRWNEDRLGCPDRNGRRRGAARRCVPAGGGRKISGDHELRALRQGPGDA